MSTSSVFDVILSRRDERNYLPKPVSKQTVEKLIEAAVWAPNHKWTEPWRFVGILENSRSAFIDAYCNGIENMPSKLGLLKPLVGKAKKVKRDFNKVPLFLAVSYKTNENEITDRENLITVSCGIQNMLLVAEELGISAHWGSGKATRTPEVTQYLGFAKDEVLLGIFQMGYPTSKSVSKRSDFQKFLRWI